MTKYYFTVSSFSGIFYFLPTICYRFKDCKCFEASFLLGNFSITLGRLCSTSMEEYLAQKSRTSV